MTTTPPDINPLENLLSVIVQDWQAVPNKENLWEATKTFASNVKIATIEKF